LRRQWLAFKIEAATPNYGCGSKQEKLHGGLPCLRQKRGTKESAACRTVSTLLEQQVLVLTLYILFFLLFVCFMSDNILGGPGEYFEGEN
jgi:hypothetical protein